MRRAVLTFSARNRRRKSEIITAFMRRHGIETVLLVGCGSGTSSNELIVERAVASQADIVAASDVLPVESEWPFVRADGRMLPFRDGAVDMILANAVIEHVGDGADQKSFVVEQSRVARTWVITTPNRWFPVESHTSAVIVHWLRPWRDRRLEFTRLLSRREFRALLPHSAMIVGRPWSATFTAFYAPGAGGRGP
jgi:SAM-dependent methyltransferase